jgi:hypothetical protein
MLPVSFAVLAGLRGWISATPGDGRAMAMCLVVNKSEEASGRILVWTHGALFFFFLSFFFCILPSPDRNNSRPGTDFVCLLRINDILLIVTELLTSEEV